MKLSVLVPAYNAERFLGPFLQSLANQYFDGLEFVLVDDCSTDGTLGKLREFEKKMRLPGVWEASAVRIIELPENVGVSVARQTAMDAAQGEYIIFADPDDTIDSEMYEKLLIHAERTNADLVWEDFFADDVRRSQAFDVSAEGMIAAILEGRIHGAMWNKLIRRSFVDEHNVRFYNGRLGLCEDVDFLCHLLAKNPKVAYCEGCHYRYQTVIGSATHGLSVRSFDDLQIVSRRLGDILKTEITKRALLRWRKGNRLAVFLSPCSTRSYFEAFDPDCIDLAGLRTNRLLKALFWMACHGGYGFARVLLRFWRRLKGQAVK